MAPGVGVTFAPGRTRIRPSMMIESVAETPLRTMRSPSAVGPRVTSRGSTVPLSVTTISSLRDWSVTTALSGTSSTIWGSEAGARTWANWPGSSSRSGLANTARRRRVPAPRLSWLSTKSIWPLWLQWFSSTSRAWTETTLSWAERSLPAATPRL